MSATGGPAGGGTGAGTARPARTALVAATCLFALTLAVQAALAIQYRTDPFRDTYVSDALSYHEWAARVAARGLAAEPVFHQAPLFPVSLALLYRAGESASAPARALALQAVWLALAIALLVPLGRLLFRSTAAGVTAGALALLYGPLAFHGLKLLPVPLALATQALALVCVSLARVSRRSVALGAAAGLACGVACLARAELLLFVPVAAAALAWPPADAQPRRRALVLAGFAAGLALGLAPATAHNARQGDLVLISASSGENLFIGNQRGADGGHTPLHDQAGDLFSQRALARAIAEEAAGRELRPSEVSAHWRARAMREVLADPRAWLGLELRKLGRLLDPGDPTDMYSLALERDRYLPLLHALPVPTAGLWLLGVLGLALAARAHASRAWPAAALLAIHVAVLLLFFVSTRLRLPAIFFLAPFAGLALAEGCRMWREGRRRGLLAALVLALALFGVHERLALRPTLRDEIRLASVLSRQSRLDEALDVLAARLTAEPPDAEALDHAGWIRSKRGDLEQARELYLRALAAGLPSPAREAQTHSRLAGVLERLGRTDEAAARHDRAVEVAPGSAGARHERALFLLRSGRPDEALEDLREAARLAPAWDEPRRALRRLGVEVR